MAEPGRPRKCDTRVADLRSKIRLGHISDAKQTLNDFGIDVSDGDGRTALINAVIENKVDFACWLIENKADVNFRDRNGYSALHFAAQDLNVKIANILLVNGANPNIQDKYGNSPLWTAVFSSMGEDIGIVKTLLNYEADPDLVNNFGATPGSLYKDRYGEAL
jgi:ankyrin repeat protein